jgi:hypothetical protein
MGRMEIVAPTASYAVISRRAGRNINNRVWKLPQAWKHRTLPHLLGKPTERVSHSSHTPFLLAVNQRGSVLVSSGGQKILSLDIPILYLHQPFLAFLAPPKNLFS